VKAAGRREKWRLHLGRTVFLAWLLERSMQDNGLQFKAFH
jgi:hypothetical protein